VKPIPDRHETNAYRAVYTTRFPGRIYVLHAFQKKSTTGSATPQKEIELIRQRLAGAARHDNERQD
jgi:phage-related protein